MAYFRQESLLSSFGENHPLHSRFQGFQSNYEATGNVFDHSYYPSINLNLSQLKIQIKKIEQKIEKKQGVPLASFSNF